MFASGGDGVVLVADFTLVICCTGLRVVSGGTPGVHALVPLARLPVFKHHCFELCSS